MKTIDFPELALMRDGIDYRFTIRCRKLEVPVRPLCNLEIIQASAAAAEAFEKLPDNQRITLSASLLNAMYHLERASSSDVGERGSLTLQLLQMMTSEEVNHLWKQYVRVTDRVNPSFEDMSAEDIEATVESLKKNSDPDSILTDLSISALITVCRRLLRP